MTPICVCSNTPFLTFAHLHRAELTSPLPKQRLTHEKCDCALSDAAAKILSVCGVSWRDLKCRWLTAIKYDLGLCAKSSVFVPISSSYSFYSDHTLHKNSLLLLLDWKRKTRLVFKVSKTVNLQQYFPRRNEWIEHQCLEKKS